jgi:tetratricopeptide (TPR) repeat protein
LVAVASHRIGIVYREAGQGEAAEDAYRRSLAIMVQSNDVAGQAGTLNQLGLLYANVLGRPEDAVTHCRQAADRYVELQDVAGEGRARSNLANTLRRLGRLAEARREIERAIECMRGLGHAAEPWKTWGILADIERADGHPAEARRAAEQARDAYLAYRRDGGESQNPRGRLAVEIGRLLTAGDRAGAGALLQPLAAKADPPAWLPPLLTALQVLVAGQRSPSIADAPELDYDDAAEVLLLLETLTAAGH